MIKQIVFWVLTLACLGGGIYMLYTFDGLFKLSSIILLGAFYGLARLKITGKW